MKRLIIMLSFTLVLMASSCNNEMNNGEIKVVTPEEMQTLIEQKDVQLVDVRTPMEYETGHIGNAQNIDYNSPTFDEDINKLDKAKPVIVYCKSGGRSAKCSDKLKAAGFVKIFDLEGGITQWKYSDFAIRTN